MSVQENNPSVAETVREQPGNPPLAAQERPRLPIHPVANIFPLATSGPRYEAFKEGIRVNQQQHDILTCQGQIIDGRTRDQACRDLGIEPRFREWDGKGDPVELVISLNLPTRELSPAQRAMSAAKAKVMFEEAAQKRMKAGRKIDDPPMNAEEGSEKGEAAEKVAKLFSIGVDSVYKAQKVLKKGSARLQEVVESGEVSISAAAKLIELPVDEQNKVVAGGDQAVQAAVAKIRKQKNEQQAIPKNAGQRNPEACAPAAPDKSEEKEEDEQSTPETRSVAASTESGAVSVAATPSLESEEPLAPATSEASADASEEKEGEQSTPETRVDAASTESGAVSLASPPSSESVEACEPAASEASEEKEEAKQPTPESDAGLAPPSDPIPIVNDAIAKIGEQIFRLGFYGLDGLLCRLVGLVDFVGYRMTELEPEFPRPYEDWESIVLEEDLESLPESISLWLHGFGDTCPPDEYKKLREEVRRRTSNPPDILTSPCCYSITDSLDSMAEDLVGRGIENPKDLEEFLRKALSRLESDRSLPPIEIPEDFADGLVIECGSEEAEEGLRNALGTVSSFLSSGPVGAAEKRLSDALSTVRARADENKAFEAAWAKKGV